MATAGSDTHAAYDYSRRPGLNVVYADELSERALLAAVQRGHLYLSSGPELRLNAQGPAGEAWLCGDTAVGSAVFAAAWTGSPPHSRLRVIANGRPLSEVPAADQGRHTWQLRASEASWTLVELRAADGEPLAITNPIYLE